MSGVSLALAPGSNPDPEETTRQPPQQTVVGGIMGSLRVIELQLVAFIMVFSASGLVPLFDLAFPAFTTIYLLLLSRLAFPNSSTTRHRSEIIFQGNRLFRAYVILGTTIGLFLPLAYVLGGFARGDEHAVQSATPHLFLLSCQILTENIISGLSLFSLPVRALVPMLYTVRRIFVVLDWVQDVWLNKTLPVNAEIKWLILCAGCCLVLVWKGSSCGQSGLFFDQSVWVFDSQVPSKSIRSLLEAEKGDGKEDGGGGQAI
ncbi:uncharacterized protein LOC112523253 isoform X2 [Cynara cardunculus var. scolymus]|uniref:uncharacterized protein LOC112523253 isoform X2 n=1 Tax=Cynara cardunculus var. scolymus TaxID=59895 RepID=UPI000D62AF60|nr:uncharacterized protein LOC112523253 isoform X2 [Cynara cardunculus var. scolymus]